MKNRTIIIAIFAFVAIVVATSCKKNLDLFPPNDLTTEQVYATPEGYMGVLAKVYGGLSMTGNQGPSGQPDIAGGLDRVPRYLLSGVSSICRNFLLMKP